MAPTCSRSSHALIFFTAGEAVPIKPAIEAGWQPWLDGRGTRAAALDAVLARRN